MSTLLSWLKDAGKLRLGRRTPETVYVSFDDNLDDRTTNFPVTLIQDVDLGQFVVDAVNEKLERLRNDNIDPEAWLADQLAQLSAAVPGHDGMKLDMEPGDEAFDAVQKLAQEYGEMCATRALTGYEDLTIVTKDEGGLHVLVGGVEVRPLAEVFPDGGTALREMGAGPLAVVHGLDDEEVVR